MRARVSQSRDGTTELTCAGVWSLCRQVLELDSGTLAGVTGHVAFHPAFPELEAE